MSERKCRQVLRRVVYRKNKMRRTRYFVDHTKAERFALERANSGELVLFKRHVAEWYENGGER